MEMMTTEQSWMIKACLAKTTEEQQEAVQHWEENVCIDEMDFSSMRLIPYFFHRNQQAGITTKHDKRIKVIYKHWWLRCKHIVHQLKVVQDVFSQAGIKVVVIKGASIKSHYEKEELRPMADFDLLISKNDLELAFQLLKELNFEADKTQKAYLEKCKNLFLEFHHAISLTSPLNDVLLDLHWKIGSGCSNQFKSNLLENLENYELNSFAKKPKLAYEVFMLIVHAVDSGNKDNLNWIIDIAVINKKYDKSFWSEARRIAVAEKKQDLFDYGCAILLKLGVSAPIQKVIRKPITLVSFDLENRTNISRIQKQSIRFKYSVNAVNRLFPHGNLFGKSYHLIRKIRYSFIIGKTKRKV